MLVRLVLDRHFLCYFASGQLRASSFTSPRLPVRMVGQ